MLCSPCLEQLVNGVPNAISNCKLYYLIDEVVPQQFLYLEDQTNVLKEEDYKARFMEVIHYEILINRNKWRPGNNSKNGICISKWLRTLFLIALTMDQKRRCLQEHDSKPFQQETTCPITQGTAFHKGRNPTRKMCTIWIHLEKNQSLSGSKVLVLKKADKPASGMSTAMGRKVPKGRRMSGH